MPWHLFKGLSLLETPALISREGRWLCCHVPKSFAEQSRERAKPTPSTRSISEAPAVPPWPLQAPGGRCPSQHPCVLTSHWTLTIVPSFHLHCSQGVQLLGIGTFCVLKDYTCAVDSEVSFVRRPMFQMSKVIADEYNLRHTQEDVPGKKTEHTLCLPFAPPLRHVPTALQA